MEEIFYKKFITKKVNKTFIKVPAIEVYVE